MTSKSTLVLLLSFAAVAFSASAPTDPNDAAAKLRFERSPDPSDWTILAPTDDGLIPYPNPGSIRPTCMAKIILPRDEVFSGPEAMEMAMHSPLAQKLSPAQREFLAQGFGARHDTGPFNVANHYSVDFYAVSEEDAKIMARALIDKFAENARKVVASERQELQKRQESLKQNQADLPEKEKQLEDVRKQYEAAKSSVYPLSDDSDAWQLAKDLILQMAQQTKTLDVELAGVRGKLEVIGEYLAKPGLNNNIVETLEAQQIEQMIELSGLEARRRAMRQICDEQQRFCTLLDTLFGLEQSLEQMKEVINRDQDVVTGITNRLANPPQYMVPPKVYQNKVILYSVAGEDSPN